MSLIRKTIRCTATALVLGLGLATASFAQQTISMNIPPDTTHRQISVKVTKGLLSTAKLPTPALRAARKAMLAGKEISTDDLRALADHWDGLAAQKYVRYLTDPATKASASDIAYYGTIAVSTGRVWSLPEVVTALQSLDPATEPAPRKKAYAAMLYPYAWAGNSLALDAVIDLNGKGKLFGPMSEATQDRLIQQSQKAGDGRVALRLALMLVQQPDRTKADVDLAKQYLKLAQASKNPEVQATATNLYTLLGTDGALTAAKE